MLELNSVSSHSDKEDRHVIRKFINSAIYIEKPASASVSSENTSISHKYSNEDLMELQNLRTKRCTCTVDRKTCPCHLNKLSANSFTETMPKRIFKVLESKTKLSQTSTTSSQNIDKEAAIKNWLAKKEEEKRKREMKEKLEREAKEKERQALLEQERQNFKMWLLNKKKSEMEAKRKKEKEMEEKRMKEMEKEKRQLENKLKFQLWVKKKEEIHLEKKIQEQMQLISELERKEKQMKENERAFQEWLKNSKNKQKPPPLNKGLQSLCSTTSITYVNPNPWKSTSQNVE